MVVFLIHLKEKKMNWKKFGMRLAQGGLIAGIVVGLSQMFGYVYDTNHYTYAILTIIFGSITLTLMVVLVAAINNRINEDKEEA